MLKAEGGQAHTSATITPHQQLLLVSGTHVGEHSTMNEITFEVERDESGWLIASWDAPDGKGGIATQGQDLRELQENVKEAVVCHFEAAAAAAGKPGPALIGHTGGRGSRALLS